MNPSKKEKHFLITEVEFDEEGIVVLCCIEAVFSKRSASIDWRSLKDKSHWLAGWK